MSYGFAPVFLPEDRLPDGRASQTFLRHYARCPRSGYLYLLHKGEAPARELVRGSAFHEIAARGTALAIINDGVQVPPDVVKAEAAAVLAEMPVVFEDHDIVREMAYRWASQTTFDPSKIVACESLFTLEVAGWQVRAKVDFAELREGGAAIQINDYKTSRAALPYDQISRTRKDGTKVANTFQLEVYAVLLAFGYPVRVEDCPVCAGYHPDEPCDACDGEGHLEFPEPFSLAQNVQRFDVDFVYPAIEDRDENMVRRGMSLNRLELQEAREALEAIVRRLQTSIETGDWPAIISDAACGECPAASQCPIPAELRDHRGTVNTDEQAAEAFAKLEREKAEHRARGAELRKVVEARGSVFFGGKVAEIVMQESEKIDKKDEMFAAMQRAVDFGEPFDRSKYVKRVQSFPLKVRDATPEEVEESNNGGQL
jgi:hypothetical protein